MLEPDDQMSMRSVCAKDRIQRELEALRALHENTQVFQGKARNGNTRFQWEISARNGGPANAPGWRVLINLRTCERTERPHWKTVLNAWQPSLQSAWELKQRYCEEG